MTALSPDRLARSVLNAVNPGLSVKELEAVPSTCLQLLYNVNVSEGPSLLLALPPPAIMRLLRSEKSPVGSEAAVLKWLSGLSNNSNNSRGRTSSRDMLSVTNNSKSISGKHTSSSPKAAKALSKYLPILVRHESKDDDLAVEYNLIRPPCGVAISSLSRPLTLKERRVIDFQTGQLLRCISSQLSPTRRFGMVADVLPVPASTSQGRRLEGSLHASRGADCWSVAFHSLMESILRDGEDLSIMISYGAIRRHFDRFEHLLDAVTKPRLVVLDAGEDANTLVFQSSETGKKMNSLPEKINGKRQESKSARGPPIRFETKPPVEYHYKQPGGEKDNRYARDCPHLTDSKGKGHIEVTGLRQWTNCLFGDPLIASVFSNRPTRDFWNGFDRSLTGDEDVEGQQSSIIEDESNAHIRLLLYECYHAVVAVVREFYRPQTDSSKRELAARKQLGDVLARLDELDDVVIPRRRRPSGEVSPAKRPRSDGVDD